MVASLRDFTWLVFIGLETVCGQSTEIPRLQTPLRYPLGPDSLDVID